MKRIRVAGPKKSTEKESLPRMYRWDQARRHHRTIAPIGTLSPKAGHAYRNEVWGGAVIAVLPQNLNRASIPRLSSVIWSPVLRRHYPRMFVPSECTLIRVRG